MLSRPPAKIIAHIGDGEHTFHASLICNPYFAATGANALVVPFACPPENYRAFLASVFRNHNVGGALIAVPHKMVTANLVAKTSRAAKVADACGAVRVSENGLLEGEIFEGEGFVRSMRQQGFSFEGKSVLLLGCGGMGGALASALAEAGVARIRLYDRDGKRSGGLFRRLRLHYLGLKLETACNDARGMDLVINAMPQQGQTMPTDVARIEPNAWVHEVWLNGSPFLQAARQRGCRVSDGMGMLFEQIPLYLSYFGLADVDAQGLQQVLAQAVQARAEPLKTTYAARYGAVKSLKPMAEYYQTHAKTYSGMGY